MNKIELRPIDVDPKYLEKWNSSHYSSFCHLYKNGEKVSDTLYRKGGFSTNLNDKYFMILKYTESYYNDNITKEIDRKPHLSGNFTIIDNDAVERISFESYKNPYLFGCVYSINNKYYNIETGELYCDSYTTIKTENFIFLNNRYDDDKRKRGVLKINKNDGTWELFN